MQRHELAFEYTKPHHVVRIRHGTNCDQFYVKIFVLNEYQKYRNEEYKYPVPIFLCGNPNCGKLVMPRRIGRKTFCSDECKAAKQRLEIPQGEQTDYQWLYRLSKKKSEGAKRAELRRKGSFDRFMDIKAHDYGPRCRRLVEKLERFAPKSIN
jgi:hypothetical protein